MFNRTSSLVRALAELGRIAETLFLLAYARGELRPLRDASDPEEQEIQVALIPVFRSPETVLRCVVRRRAD